ncbi:unnamed protein product [Phytophthora lilii]|uniref:Unnamed protein product n=1 Tax=Phytophthora lilii TaxID=2077276 RepID=A0A9W6TKQ5_9STRA|nr:unnamed protein product [Phytophthora lilii]
MWVDDLLIYAQPIDELLEIIDVIYSQLENCIRSREDSSTSTHAASDHRWKTPAISCCRVDAEQPCRFCAHKPASLQARLDNELAGTRRTKRVAANIWIELTPLEVESFQAVKTMLEHAATLAFPDPEGTICMLSNASNDGWRIIVTLVKAWSKSTAAEDQQHDLLYCMSESFHGASQNWSIVEKEGYPSVCACSELEYLLIRDKGFKMFTDHRNLIYIFAPGAEINKHVRGKLLRWSLKLNEYQYEIEHMPREQNVWADMFSRWAGQEQTTARTASMKRWRHEQTSKLRPLVDLEWPTISHIAAAQSGKVAPLSHTLDDRGFRLGGLIQATTDSQYS